MQNYKHETSSLFPDPDLSLIRLLLLVFLVPDPYFCSFRISSRFSIIRFFTCLRKSTWAVSPVNSFGETGARARRHILEGKSHQRFGGRSLSVPIMHSGTIGAPVSIASLKGPE